MKIKFVFAIAGLVLSFNVSAQDGTFQKLSVSELVKGAGSNDYYGWGINSNTIFDPRPSHANGGAFVMNHHTGLTFSAHSVYGGIRFYNQSYPEGPLNPATGAVMVMSLSNGNVGIGTTNPENSEGWERVLEIRGGAHAKSVVSSNQVQTGIWSHNLGYYGAPAGGITGTYTDHPFSIMTNRSTKMTIASNGNVGIGTTTPNEKLSVNGNVRAREIKVENNNWPDYVFAKDYTLPSLTETEKHIKENGHLPGIPSAAEVTENGINLGDLNAKLLQKIEELTLHLIEMEKKNELLNKRVIMLEYKGL